MVLKINFKTSTEYELLMKYIRLETQFVHSNFFCGIIHYINQILIMYLLLNKKKEQRKKKNEKLMRIL